MNVIRAGGRYQRVFVLFLMILSFHLCATEKIYLTVPGVNNVTINAYGAVKAQSNLSNAIIFRPEDRPEYRVVNWDIGLLGSASGQCAHAMWGDNYEPSLTIKKCRHESRPKSATADDRGGVEIRLPYISRHTSKIKSRFQVQQSRLYYIPRLLRKVPISNPLVYAYCVHQDVRAYELEKCHRSYWRQYLYKYPEVMNEFPFRMQLTDTEDHLLVRLSNVTGEAPIYLVFFDGSRKEGHQRKVLTLNVQPDNPVESRTIDNHGVQLYMGYVKAMLLPVVVAVLDITP